jgi:hypothetical protein
MEHIPVKEYNGIWSCFFYRPSGNLSKCRLVTGRGSYGRDREAPAIAEYETMFAKRRTTLPMKYLANTPLCRPNWATGTLLKSFTCNGGAGLTRTFLNLRAYLGITFVAAVKMLALSARSYGD